MNTDEQAQRALLSKAFGGCLATVAALLTVWRGSLPSDRAAQLAELEEHGMRLGISVKMPADRYVIEIFMVDAAGQVERMDTLEQPGPLPSVN